MPSQASTATKSQVVNSSKQIATISSLQPSCNDATTSRKRVAGAHGVGGNVPSRAGMGKSAAKHKLPWVRGVEICTIFTKIICPGRAWLVFQPVVGRQLMTKLDRKSTTPTREKLPYIILASSSISYYMLYCQHWLLTSFGTIWAPAFIGMQPVNRRVV